MPSINDLVARNNVIPVETVDPEDEKSRETINLLIGFLGLVFFGAVMVTCLWYLRRVKQRRAMMGTGLLPPPYQQPDTLTIQTTDKHGRSSVLVISKDGHPMLANPGSPPHSPDNVPQIHITFPDEQDEGGRTTNGRVMLVRVGDSTVGLEPVTEEQLPAYEKESKSQFYSIDMDHIGGLKEKDRNYPH